MAYHAQPPINPINRPPLLRQGPHGCAVYLLLEQPRPGGLFCSSGPQHKNKNGQTKTEINKTKMGKNGQK